MQLAAEDVRAMAEKMNQKIFEGAAASVTGVK